MNPKRRATLYLLIFFSGMSGLIYEVVWHRYLAILLGAQARATAIVLAIFLGGIAFGYAFFGRWSRWKSWNLLRVYAIVEIGLGLWGSLFPLFFRVAEPVSSRLYALLGVSNLGIDIGLSLLMIGPPTFLMGGTLPLLTQGLSEDLKEASKTHATIYGSNTVGACFGCLLAGYYLIPSFGLIGSLWVACSFNFIVGLAVYFGFAWKKPVQKVKSARSGWDFQFLPEHKFLFAIAFLSGFYLLTLQTLLIRLMGLSTGSSNYNFALIVSIFILGLGLGSLLVKRISNYSAKNLFWNQVAVVIGLFLLYRSGAYWAYGAHVVRSLFRDQSEGFLVFQIFLGLGFTALLILPIGFAGLTLPLCFHLLKDRTDTLGQRVGQLYGLNSLGCVFGALIGGYALYEYWNIDQLFKFCVFLTAISSVCAAWLYFYDRPNIPAFSGAAVAVLGVCVWTWFSPLYSKNQFIQPFRHASPISNVTYEGAKAFGDYLGRSTEYVYYKDGPNTSVGIGATSFDGKEVSRTIFINGKSDGNTKGDYFTTVMLAHIPALLAAQPERACVIGFGTGTTVGTLALYEDVKDIQVAEISGTLIEHASLFDNYNNNASKSPKVHFNEMDAFRYLEGTDKTFNVIVSEPSNPWVAGIENLYSSEFYRLARKKLASGGVFVQWIHTYSFNDDLFRMVLATMSQHFGAVSVYQLRGGDYAIVASEAPFDRGDLRRGQHRLETSTTVQDALRTAGLQNFESVLALEIVPFSLSKIMSTGAPIHTLESPKLSNEAAQAFFANTSSKVESLRKNYKEYYASISDSLLTDYFNGKLAGEDALQSFRDAFCDNSTAKNSDLCEETLAALKIRNPLFDPTKLYESTPSQRDLASLENYAKLKPPKKFTNTELQEVEDMFETLRKYYSPVAQIPVEPILGRLDFCLKTVSKLDGMYGECLLQKILVFETIRLSDAEFKESATQFLNWFDILPPATSNYTKLKEARDILLKMIRTEKNSSSG